MKRITALLLFFVVLVGTCALNIKAEEPDYIGDFEIADFDKFNSYASENGLGGTKVVIEGEVLGEFVTSQTYSLIIRVDNKKIWVANVWVAKDDLAGSFDNIYNKIVRVFGQYDGFSDVLHMPVVSATVEGGGIMLESDNDSFEPFWSYVEWLTDNPDIIQKYVEEYSEDDGTVQNEVESIEKEIAKVESSIKEQENKLKELRQKKHELEIEGDYVEVDEMGLHCEIPSNLVPGENSSENFHYYSDPEDGFVSIGFERKNYSSHYFTIDTFRELAQVSIATVSQFEDYEEHYNEITKTYYLTYAVRGYHKMLVYRAILGDCVVYVDFSWKNDDYKEQFDHFIHNIKLTKPYAWATLAKYNQIEIGMSYDELIDITGGEGNIETEFGTMKIYSWESKDGMGEMIITVQDDLVSDKSMFGLK